MCVRLKTRITFRIDTCFNDATRQRQFHSVLNGRQSDRLGFPIPVEGVRGFFFFVIRNRIKNYVKEMRYKSETYVMISVHSQIRLKQRCLVRSDNNSVMNNLV